MESRACFQLAAELPIRKGPSLIVRPEQLHLIGVNLAVDEGCEIVLRKTLLASSVSTDINWFWRCDAELAMFC